MAKQDSSTDPRPEPQSTSERLPAWIRATYSSVLGAILALFIISMFVCVVLLLLGQFGLVTLTGEEGFLADAFSLPTVGEDALTATALAAGGDSLSQTATAEAGLASSGDSLSLTATAEARSSAGDSLSLTATAEAGLASTADALSKTATAEALATTETSLSQTATAEAALASTAEALSLTATAEAALTATANAFALTATAEAGGSSGDTLSGTDSAASTDTPSPTPTPQIIIFATLTGTPSATPTPTPSATRTPTTTGPTPTPFLLLFPTLTATPSATPTGPTPTPQIIIFPTLTTTPGAGTSTPTPTPTPTPIFIQISPPPSGPPGLPSGTLTLISPRGLDVPSYGPTTFVWEWVGEPILPQFGFEVYVWLPGEFQAGVHNAVRDNQQEGDLQQVSPTRYQLNVTDIRFARGVMGRTANYQWTVGIIQVSPTYETFGLQPPPAMFRYENPN